jgi:hypothetical protein
MRAGWWIGVMVAFTACASNSKDSPQAGEERGPCKADGTCNGVLQCRSDLCVRESTPPAEDASSAGGAAGASSLGTGGVSGTTGTGGGSGAAGAPPISEACAIGAYQGPRAIPTFTLTPTAIPTTFSVSGNLLVSFSTADVNMTIDGLVDCSKTPPDLTATLNGAHGTQPLTGAMQGTGDVVNGVPSYSGGWNITGDLATPKFGTWAAQHL